jgi:hypothetical protein
VKAAGQVEIEWKRQMRKDAQGKWKRKRLKSLPSIWDNTS